MKFLQDGIKPVTFADDNRSERPGAKGNKNTFTPRKS
jgi:hypothetical protein